MSNTVSLVPIADASDASEFGGKAAGLHAIASAGAPVPAGVVIGAQVFEDHLRRIGLDKQVHALRNQTPQLDPTALTAQCEQLQAAIVQSDLDQPLINELTAFRRRTNNAVMVVRSSAIGEDGHSASFAGQFDSVLDTDSDQALPANVLQVWASLFRPSAWLYGQQNKCPVHRMAVLIQEQIDPLLSGVLFTIDPTRPATDTMVIECCAGLSDRLVSGDIDPARGIVSSGSCEIQWSDIAGLNTLVSDFGIADALTGLIQLARKLANEQDRPLDIEWCIDRNAQLLLVQCRPVTTSHAAHPDSRVEVWSNANIAENYPEPVVPMLASFAGRGYAGYFRGLGTAIGVSRARIDAMAPILERLVGTQGGRLYYNLTNIHSVLHMAPAGRWLARSFNLFTGTQGSPELVKAEQSKPAAVLEAVRIAVKLPTLALTVPWRLKRFERRVDAFAGNTVPAEVMQKSPMQLAGLMKGFVDIRVNHWTDAALADAAAMTCYAGLKAALRRWFDGDSYAQLQNDLLQGLPGLASARPVEKLWELANHLCEDRDQWQVMRSMTAEQLLAAVQSGQFPAFRLQLEKYLEHDGFRYSGELMLVQPTPAENPLPIIRLIQSYWNLQSDGPAKIVAQRAIERESITARAIDQLSWLPAMRGWPGRALAFKYLVKATQSAIAFRERARMKQARLYTRLRLVALALGEHCVAHGKLDTPEDIFFLTIDEAIAQGSDWDKQTDDTHALRSLVARRRATHAEHWQQTPPDQFECPKNGSWRFAQAPGASDSAGDAVLAGIGGCGGVYEGAAAVALDVTDTNNLANGAILVTRQTDPGWASVFFTVKALVVERGGMLSHGAIIAREYGIPAVIGVKNATTLIADGEQIRVDGDRGQVGRCNG